jgi:cytochrome P450
VPGFEAQTVLQSADDVVLNVVKTKLGQNDGTMGPMSESLAVGLREIWGEGCEWHTINWYKDTMELIARAASSVFVGPEKASDREWLDLVQGYVMAYFSAVSELHQYPKWSRWIVHWFLPNAIACRKYVPRARTMMREVLEKRRQEVEKAELEGADPPRYNDALSWVEASSGGRAEPGDIQLSLAMAALFTTSEAFRQVLIDVARHPGLVDELRNEVSKQISEHGISVAATSNMVLLDSVMKESQRLSSGTGLYRSLLIRIFIVLTLTF